MQLLLHLKENKKKNILCTDVVGERERVDVSWTGCEASGCTRVSVLLQHALDGLVGRFVIQMLGCVPARDRWIDRPDRAISARICERNTTALAECEKALMTVSQLWTLISSLAFSPQRQMCNPRKTERKRKEGWRREALTQEWPHVTGREWLNVPEGPDDVMCRCERG